MINILGPAGPTLASNMHTSVHMVGSILTAEGAGGVAASMLVPALLKRYHGHRVLFALALFEFFCLGAIPSCSSITQMSLIYFWIGSCVGLTTCLSNTLLTWVQAGRNVGPWVNMVNSSFGLGSISAPLLFVMVERYVGNGLASYSAIACFAAVTALAAWILQSP